MAYTVGSGATTADFMDALRSFAVGLGWTINRFDATAKRLYMAKDACRVCFSWKSYNITSYDSGSAVVIQEGIIQGSLVASFGTGDAYNTFPGAGSKVALSTSLTTIGGEYSVLMSYMQGPFVNWFLFSNANGDYIHAIVQVGSDRYRFLTFGNVDKGGLSHSGAAYLSSDGGDNWFRGNTGSTNEFYYADPRYCSSHFGITSNARFSMSHTQMFSIDALPLGFDNNVGFGTYNYNASTSKVQTLQHVMQLRRAVWISDNYPSKESFSSSCGLLDNVVASAAPAWAQNVPLFGLPLVAINSANTQACCVGSVPDFRLVNMQGMSPQQEIAITSDTWKIFPVIRQDEWSNSRVHGNIRGGQYGFAIKKIS